MPWAVIEYTRTNPCPFFMYRSRIAVNCSVPAVSRISSMHWWPSTSTYAPPPKICCVSETGAHRGTLAGRNSQPTHAGCASPSLETVGPHRHTVTPPQLPHTRRSCGDRIAPLVGKSRSGREAGTSQVSRHFAPASCKSLRLSGHTSRRKCPAQTAPSASGMSG